MVCWGQKPHYSEEGVREEESERANIHNCVCVCYKRSKSKEAVVRRGSEAQGSFSSNE